MSTLAENLLAAVKGVAALAGAGCVALLGALYAFQRKLIFAGHAMDIGPALPIRKGRKIEVDVRNEQRPRGAPDTLVGVYFPPTKPNAKTLAFWHGNADQLGNVADFLGQALQQRLVVGFLGIEYPGYALCTSGEPTETTIHWTSQRMLRHLRETLKTPGLKLLTAKQIRDDTAKAHGYELLPEHSRMFLPIAMASALKAPKGDYGDRLRE